MKKRLRLKKEIKERLVAILVIGLFFAILIGGTMLYMNRIDKISSGDMTLVSDSEMDR